MTAQRQYELVYIVSPEATDEQAKEIDQLIQEVVTRHQGTVDNTENWGRRKLAFQIKHKREGVYVVMVISGLGDMVKEIERRLKVHDFVLRHLVVRVDEDLRKAARIRARREEQAARRQAARGSTADSAGEPAEPPTTDSTESGLANGSAGSATQPEA
ncbi:MAG: 30S ribosomal protein S6 [Luteitalea sp.]|nr:30S ribosomal protein S6 [Luteitalea sp.]